jgi:3',5'-cyclic AMP phosphodiesterase CpdA
LGSPVGIGEGGRTGGRVVDVVKREFDEGFEGVIRTGRERNVLSDAGDILYSLITKNADLVLSGHKHVPHVWIVHETAFATAGTVSSLKLRGKDLSSFNTINISEDIIDVILNRADGKTKYLANYENRCR